MVETRPAQEASTGSVRYPFVRLSAAAITVHNTGVALAGALFTLSAFWTLIDAPGEAVSSPRDPSGCPAGRPGGAADGQA